MPLSFVNGCSWDWEHMMPQVCGSLECDSKTLFEVAAEWAKENGHRVGTEDHHGAYLSTRSRRVEGQGEGPRIPGFVRRFIANELNLVVTESASFAGPDGSGKVTTNQVIANREAETKKRVTGRFHRPSGRR